MAVASLHPDHAEEVSEMIKQAGGSAVSTTVDIGVEDSVIAAVDAAVSTFGGLDAIYINAGDMSRETIGNDTDAQSIDLDVLDRTIRTNLRGYLLCVRHGVPRLLNEDGGSVVCTSSAAAFIGEPQRPAYAMSKGAVHALVRHVASRWGKNGVRANAVAPGPILTAQAAEHMEQAMKEAMLTGVRSRRLGRPDDVAAMVAFLISDDGQWVNGQVISVDGGLTLR